MRCCHLKDKCPSQGLSCFAAMSKPIEEPNVSAEISLLAGQLEARFDRLSEKMDACLNEVMSLKGRPLTSIPPGPGASRASRFSIQGPGTPRRAGAARSPMRSTMRSNSAVSLSANPFQLHLDAMPSSPGMAPSQVGPSPPTGPPSPSGAPLGVSNHKKEESKETSRVFVIWLYVSLPFLPLTSLTSLT